MSLMQAGLLQRFGATVLTAMLGLSIVAGDGLAADDTPAKQLFGAVTLPSRATPQSYGFYAKGCLAGGVAIPTDGPTWQAMRLSRNRRWGNPHMIALIERLSDEAARKDGWPGLLLGDISQPRGGPMLTGHASHQIGLDADIWLTPMPKRTLTTNERETIQATSMLQKNKFLTVDPKIWTPGKARLIMRAASYPEVERVFVNPAIKKKLCETWTGDRTDLGKVRPIYGHDYHFHIRMKCPADAPNCKPQAAVTPGDGCDKSLAWWFTQEPWAKPKAKPDVKPVKPVYTKLRDLPNACSVVLEAPAASEAASTFGGASAARVQPEDPRLAPVQAMQGGATPPADIPVPKGRPAGQ